MLGNNGRRNICVKTDADAFLDIIEVFQMTSTVLLTRKQFRQFSKLNLENANERTSRIEALHWHSQFFIQDKYPCQNHAHLLRKIQRLRLPQAAFEQVKTVFLAAAERLYAS
jgi:hypothetical protein